MIYPFIDEHRRKYVQHPFKNENGKYEAVDIFIPGHSKTPNPERTEFETEEECQAGCDIHNDFYGWNKNVADEIISRSMGLIEKVTGTITITNCTATGNVFKNLTPGSEHTIIDPPAGRINFSDGVWVMGKGEAVKVLNSEFEIL